MCALASCPPYVQVRTVQHVRRLLNATVSLLVGVLGLECTAIALLLTGSVADNAQWGRVLFGTGTTAPSDSPSYVCVHALSGFPAPCSPSPTLLPLLLLSSLCVSEVPVLTVRTIDTHDATWFMQVGARRNLLHCHGCSEHSQLGCPSGMPATTLSQA